MDSKDLASLQAERGGSHRLLRNREKSEDLRGQPGGGPRFGRDNSNRVPNHTAGSMRDPRTCRRPRGDRKKIALALISPEKHSKALENIGKRAAALRPLRSV